ncbi:FadR/GntR family transcriptional regulator [Pseudooceanicola nanhaiensis]|uniref:GntR family transcriptional regulator n=1 Tax=Pseudooceanicola nanhaiensis TaxID=375761 RepID=A0A917WK10_9RHOB|nr:FCD domain-containing protein [Pseudooceanicola nanhaiensis]GGM09173.1 GntR family transcriptional regulator [Pseudooceanicola nanhaiensis]
MSDDDILTLLLGGIDDGRFVSGDRLLPERRLAEAMGISRARLRRTLDRLTEEGRLFRHQGQGTFISPPPALEVAGHEALARQVTPQNVMEVRIEVEPALAALAAERASRAELESLKRLMQATLGVEDMAAYEAADEVFHYRIAELAHNPLFLSIYQSVRAVRRHARWTDARRHTHSLRRITLLGRQHEALTVAIAGRDAAEAAHLMEDHLITVSNAMLRNRGARSVICD